MCGIIVQIKMNNIKSLAHEKHTHTQASLNNIILQLVYEETRRVVRKKPT